MHISIYYIYIYTCEIRRTFLLYKVLIGWLECLRIIASKEISRLEFLFFLLWRNRRTNTRTTNTQSPQKGFLELKTAWYFCYSKKKRKKKKKKGLEEQKQKLLREKRCLRVSLTFSWYVSWWKILCCSSRRQRRLVCFRHQLSETLAHSPHALVTHRLPNHSQSHPPIPT